VKAREQARVTVCMNKLNHIGKALAQYVAANRQMMPPYCGADALALAWRRATATANSDYSYTAWYSYRNMIGEYMGLGNCMPQREGDDWTQYDRWERATYTHFKEYECPSGAYMTSPYGWAVNPQIGRGEGQSYYMQNVSWGSQSWNETQSGSNWWPARAAYFPRFRETSQAILLYEYWSGNGMTGNGDACGQPYSTHYRNAKGGAEGIGRSILYADWHFAFLRTGDPTEKPFMLWGQYPYVQRGNDMGTSFADQWWGKTWMAWDLYQPLKEKG
jgi:hypothetical protein